MTNKSRVLIALADGEHVRFVRAAGDDALHTVMAEASDSAHKRSSDLGSDRPGASMHSGSTAHHAIAPRHDPHQQEKALFEHHVAHEINEAAKRDEFDSLVIVGPARALDAIRGALDPAVEARIAGTLAKDLLKTPDDELWPHLKAWLPPVRHTPPFSRG